MSLQVALSGYGKAAWRCLLLRVERTSRIRPPTSENDPSRTWISFIANSVERMAVDGFKQAGRGCFCEISSRIGSSFDGRIKFDLKSICNREPHENATSIPCQRNQRNRNVAR